ncbi:hypothetical protein [Candidatus Methanodesulfokora washburnensis]|uniref:Uncharacterized protein n=1 Tax=Candidatus Methanodesulfokora washburnensis TaxID=2478471 RepID=A0A429GU75_9CREN|nr:hypothetical protein [Candidatus Methanodesulfokores washburnensis]RSN77187.1 hypothetical protein D6D85_02900 [Candidatus Methanodesulfokores washburnensis]
MEFDDEVISQIKREATILKSMIDEIEDEFRRKGKQPIPNQSWYIRDSSLLFNAEKYAAEVHSKLYSQMRKIIRLLQKRFPWAPIDESILYNSDLCRTVSYNVRPSGSSYVSFDTNECCFPFRDLMDPYKQDEFLEELFKPVYVCIARVLQTTTMNLDPSSSYLKEYDPIVLSEALRMAENKKWIVKKDRSYLISERPIFVIKCPVCSEKVYAHEDNCPKCGFYIPNLALRTKVRLEVPASWYKYDEQRKKWVAFFKYNRSLGSENRITLGTIAWEEYELFTILICDKVIMALEEAQIIHHLPDEYYATHYTSFLRYSSTGHMETYAIYASSPQELKQIITDIMNRLKLEANREYDKGKKLVNSPIPREKFIQEFLSQIQQCFIPALDKHPVLMLENIARQDEEKTSMTKMFEWLEDQIRKVSDFIVEVEKPTKEI